MRVQAGKGSCFDLLADSFVAFVNATFMIALLLDRKLAIKMLGIGFGIILKLVSLIYCIRSYAADPDEAYVQAQFDVEGGTRVEVYEYALHDHMGVRLYLGNSRFPVARQVYFYDDFALGEVVNLGGGKIQLGNALTEATILVDARLRTESYLESYE
jgi:hypothetical protein